MAHLVRAPQRLEVMNEWKVGRQFCIHPLKKTSTSRGSTLALFGDGHERGDSLVHFAACTRGAGREWVMFLRSVLQETIETANLEY